MHTQCLAQPTSVTHRALVYVAHSYIELARLVGL